MEPQYTYEDILKSLETVKDHATVSGHPYQTVEGFKRQAEGLGYGTRPCILYFMSKSESPLSLQILRQCFDAQGNPITREQMAALP